MKTLSLSLALSLTLSLAATGTRPLHLRLVYCCVHMYIRYQMRYKNNRLAGGVFIKYKIL